MEGAAHIAGIAFDHFGYFVRKADALGVLLAVLGNLCGFEITDEFTGTSLCSITSGGIKSGLVRSFLLDIVEQ